MAREAREETNMEVEVAADAETDSVPPFPLNLYEAQYFGFTPQTCMLRVFSVFQDSLYDILPVVEKVCVRQLSKGQSDQEDEQLQTRARECSRKLQQFLEERFKQLAERMESLLLSRCLTVPPHVLLPEDQTHHKYPQEQQDVLKLESSMTDLQRAYEAEVCGRQHLLAELEEQKEVQKQLDEILSWIRELQAAWVKGGNGNFSESYRMVMESVKSLQAAVRDVYKKAPH